MALTRWLKVGAVVLAIGATASGVQLLAEELTSNVEPPPQGSPKANRADETPLCVVKPGTFEVTVVERGTVEAFRNEPAICKVPGSTRILSILPEGTNVKKGQLVCELDAAVLRDELTNQVITTKGAEAAYRNAKLTREAAENERKRDFEKERADELAKKETWELEQARETELRKEIENCKIYAPSDGPIVHANDPNRGARPPQIVKGATVRERQIIFFVPDLSEFVLNTKVHEAMIDRINRGQRARIKVDAFPNEPLTGVVVEIFVLPDPAPFTSAEKVYTTKVKVGNSPPGLKPGTSAQAEILLTDHENALSVPVQAVLHYDGRDHVAVKKSGAGFDWREVTLGVTNDKVVEVKQGIKSGESVALDALALMSEDRKLNSPAGSTPKPSSPR